MYTCVRVYAKISGSTHVHERVYYIIIMHVCAQKILSASIMF